MDWYIFLTPLLLLPIIFLFRLVGCSYPDFQYRDDGDGGPSEINITFKLIIADPIPPLVHNPDLIKYIWPMFTIDPGGEPIGYAGGSPQQMFPQTNPPGEFDKPFTITSDKVPVPAGTHTCSCDVYVTRYNIDDEEPPKPLFTADHHLRGPEPALQTGFGEISDNVITFILNYTRTSDTEYLASDFVLTPIT
jgi:hypothetical protein